MTSTPTRPASVVLITGATSGLGHATALAFARAGWRVAVTGRRAERGAELVTALRALGTEALFVRADHSREADCAHAVAETVRTFGRLDAAFNNAGTEGAVGTPLEQQSAANFEHTMALNVGGVLWSMKYELPALRASGGGAIVNTSSIAGQVGMPGGSVYAASKQAVEGLTRAAAVEAAPDKVRVNAIAPGPIQTDMADRFMGQGDSEMKRWIVGQLPLGRLGVTADIPAAVLFLCSPGSEFITGQILNIDGGFTAK